MCEKWYTIWLENVCLSFKLVIDMRVRFVLFNFLQCSCNMICKKKKNRQLCQLCFSFSFFFEHLHYSFFLSLVGVAKLLAQRNASSTEREHTSMKFFFFLLFSSVFLLPRVVLLRVIYRTMKSAETNLNNVASAKWRYFFFRGNTFMRPLGDAGKCNANRPPARTVVPDPSNMYLCLDKRAVN